MLLTAVSGVVGVFNNKSPDLEITVTANQATTVVGDSPPAPPVDVDPETQQDIIIEDGNEAIEDLPFQVPPPLEPEQTKEQTEAEEEEEESVPAGTVEVVNEQVDETTEAVSEATEAALPSGDVGITTTPVDISIGR